ncbi:bifunctional glucose-1-phosphatase/inositol phosphatase [Enterobacteriaceae bacterium ESL0689]|nr:bifunctional glucose-1-phosphatase/inositol phosphatase [Enterobacteriaceae bacterium ESL0689]
MKKNLLSGAISGAILLSIGAHAQEPVAPQGYQLQQVLIMSRHNLRAPLTTGGSVLAQSTTKSWPQWDVPGGQLTTKGGVLEVYMGAYLRAWLEQQGLAGNNKCPSENTVYVYSNSLQRTIATAQFLIAGAFPGCDVTVHHQSPVGTMDPTFNPVITDDSPAFREKAIAEMEKTRHTMPLAASYRLLEKIIDYQNSPTCKGKQPCSLDNTHDIFSAQYQQEPTIAGPLKIGNALVDAFTLQYYQGFPLNQVAWGEIKTDKQWRELSKLKNGYQDSLLSSPEVARNIAKPLVKYIDKTLAVDGEKSAKVTILVGHDSNIASLLSALNFKPYQLHNQYESTPIGGQLVFQNWHDSHADRDLIKIEYVYQSTAQLREAQPLTLQSPPQRVTLALNGCPVDANGFCSLETFKQLLNHAAQ